MESPVVEKDLDKTCRMIPADDLPSSPVDESQSFPPRDKTLSFIKRKIDENLWNSVLAAGSPSEIDATKAKIIIDNFILSMFQLDEKHNTLPENATDEDRKKYKLIVTTNFIQYEIKPEDVKLDQLYCYDEIISFRDIVVKLTAAVYFQEEEDSETKIRTRHVTIMNLSFPNEKTTYGQILYHLIPRLVACIKEDNSEYFSEIVKTILKLITPQASDVFEKNKIEEYRKHFANKPITDLAIIFSSSPIKEDAVLMLAFIFEKLEEEAEKNLEIKLPSEEEKGHYVELILKADQESYSQLLVDILLKLNILTKKPPVTLVKESPAPEENQ